MIRSVRSLRLVENVLVFPELPSTQEFSRRLVSALDEEEMRLLPTAVVAASQTSGKGRGGRTWHSPAGGIYVTMILPAPSLADSIHLPLSAAVVLVEMIRGAWNVSAAIKWPNDVLVEGRKIAGLLLELVHTRDPGRSLVLVGLGLNLETRALAGADLSSAAALSEFVAEPVHSGEVVDRILDAYDHEASFPRSREEILSRWKELSIHRPGEPIRVRRQGDEWIAGTYAGLDEVGRLVLDTDEGRKLIASADVER